MPAKVVTNQSSPADEGIIKLKQVSKEKRDGQAEKMRVVMKILHKLFPRGEFKATDQLGKADQLAKCKELLGEAPQPLSEKTIDGFLMALFNWAHTILNPGAPPLPSEIVIAGDFVTINVAELRSQGLDSTKWPLPLKQRTLADKSSWPAPPPPPPPPAAKGAALRREKRLSEKKERPPKSPKVKPEKPEKAERAPSNNKRGRVAKQKAAKAVEEEAEPKKRKRWHHESAIAKDGFAIPTRRNTQDAEVPAPPPAAEANGAGPSNMEAAVVFERQRQSRWGPPKSQATAPAVEDQSTQLAAAPAGPPGFELNPSLGASAERARSLQPISLAPPDDDQEQEQEDVQVDAEELEVASPPAPAPVPPAAAPPNDDANVVQGRASMRAAAASARKAIQQQQGQKEDVEDKEEDESEEDSDSEASSDDEVPLLVRAKAFNINHGKEAGLGARGTRGAGGGGGSSSNDGEKASGGTERRQRRQGSSNVSAQEDNRAQSTKKTPLYDPDCYFFNRQGDAAINWHTHKDAPSRCTGKDTISCHVCQYQHLVHRCKNEGCNKSYCVRCCKRYLYLYELQPGDQHYQDLLAFKSGICPCCIRICGRKKCIREYVDKKALMGPPELDAEERLRIALHVAKNIKDVAQEILLNNSSEVDRQGLRPEAVSVDKVQKGERVLCNRCATCIEDVHYHCQDQNCENDFCPSCAKEMLGDKQNELSCLTPKCGKPTQLQRICNQTLLQGLARADEILAPYAGFSTLPGGEKVLSEQPAANKQPGTNKRGRWNSATTAAPAAAPPAQQERQQQLGEIENDAHSNFTDNDSESLDVVTMEDDPSEGAEEFVSAQSPGAFAAQALGGHVTSGSPNGLSSPIVRVLLSPREDFTGVDVEIQAVEEGGPLPVPGALPLMNGAPATAAPPSVVAQQQAAGPSAAAQVQPTNWWADLDPADYRLAAQRPDGSQNCIYTPHVKAFSRDNPELRLKTVRLYMERWSHGEPIIIRGFRSRMSWHPETMATAATEQGSSGTSERRITEDILNCGNTSMMADYSVRKFFNVYTKFYGPDNDEDEMLKLKDFPFDASFVDRCKRHCDDFVEMLNSCMPEYMHPSQGACNLATTLPEYTIPPDLGPKAYIAYGRTLEHEGEGDSVTKLHEDLADAINILCHTQQKPGYDPKRDAKPARCGETPWELPAYGGAGAVWDLFKRDDLAKLRQFLTDAMEEKLGPECPTFYHKGKVLEPADVHDVIHDQCFMLTTAHRRVLKEKYGVQPWHFEQNEWEGVVIPAGCAHQVRNLKSCIKVALDYVSPESVRECVFLRQQYRQLAIMERQEGESDVADRHFHDKLQVSNMVLTGLSKALECIEEEGGPGGGGGVKGRKEKKPTAK